MSQTLGEIRRDGKERATKEGVTTRDVDLLLTDVLDCDITHLIAHADRVLKDEEISVLEELLIRRFDGEPVQYIRGHCEFYNRTFHVDNRVLIPRPETEIVCEHAMSIAKPGMRVIDVGCGSGAIGITMALENPELEVFATEYSFEALVVARENARRLGAPIEFATMDLLAACRGTLDLIVSNPPYIPEEEIPGLQREVSGHEPHVALSGGPGGLNLVKRLATQAETLLKPGGTLFMEIGWNQRPRVEQIGAEGPWEVDVRPDLSGMPRCAVFKLVG